jgi:hypothetical protein
MITIIYYIYIKNKRQKMDFITLEEQCLCHGLLLPYIITNPIGFEPISEGSAPLMEAIKTLNLYHYTMRTYLSHI